MIVSKWTIFILFFCCTIVCASEDFNEKRKKAICRLRSDIVRDKFLKKCPQDDKVCFELVEQIWQQEYENCIWSKNSVEVESPKK